MKTLSLASVDPIEQLASLSATVALEAFTLRSIGNRLADVIPTMAHAFRQFAYTHKSDKLDLTPLNVNRQILAKALSSANYLDIQRVMVCVPQGFTGNMVEYLAIMSNAIEFTNGIRERMTSYNQLISALLSDKQTRLRTSDLSTATSDMERQREAIRVALAAFSRNSRSDRQSLGDTYANLNELSQSVDATASIITAAAALNLESINTLINDAVELLDEFERRANEGTIEQLSPQMYKSLASSTLTMARDAELHSLMCYKAWECKDSMETTCKELIKTLRY